MSAQAHGDLDIQALRCVELTDPAEADDGARRLWIVLWRKTLMATVTLSLRPVGVAMAMVAKSLVEKWHSKLVDMLQACFTLGDIAIVIWIVGLVSIADQTLRLLGARSRTSQGGLRLPGNDVVPDAANDHEYDDQVYVNIVAKTAKDLGDGSELHSYTGKELDNDGVQAHKRKLDILWIE